MLIVRHLLVVFFAPPYEVFIGALPSVVSPQPILGIAHDGLLKEAYVHLRNLEVGIFV